MFDRCHVGFKLCVLGGFAVNVFSDSFGIGGLKENSTNKKIRKISLLGDIPYLGKMFRSEDINKTKTELILLLSVEILFNEKDFETQRLKFVRKI